MKKLLLIMNPKSGTMQAAKYLADIISVFGKNGYLTTVMMTEKRGDANEWAKQYGGDYDIVCASGGDGTFNEIMDGLIRGGHSTPIGYIPSGSTNDFAQSVGLSKGILEAAGRVVTGEPEPLDIGCFNGRYFSYVASFGAFTSTSYSVPQNLKNILGHTAYVLGGVKDILSIRPIHARIIADEGTPNESICEGDYIFGAICNSTSVAGILSLDKFDVDMNDGIMEVLLVRVPKDPIELNSIVVNMLNGTLNTREIEFFSARNIRVEVAEGTHWTLDGEYEPGAEICEIETLRSAISLIV
ncbi:MAG: YegS/Rv2252/BmrU family lipid kinase [Clostridiales bacterium]|nr:YegS/Rv2252/BmrU family lipid kinase [Candidatus Crickella caballi]